MTIDLSQLPPPDVVETLDAEAIAAAMAADFRSRYPDYDAWVESDPAMKLLEVAAYREALLRQRVNEAARAVMIATALGADLDNLVAILGVQRLAGESDDALRQRAVLSLEMLTTAGNGPGYRAVVLGIDASILDVEATSASAGNVSLKVLTSAADGQPGATLLAKITAAVQASHVRPLTDTVAVAGATVTPYNVTAVLHLPSGPDSASVVAAATKGLNDYAASRYRIGLGVARSGIDAALHVAGVDKVALTAPAADLAAVAGTARKLGVLTLTVNQP